MEAPSALPAEPIARVTLRALLNEQLDPRARTSSGLSLLNQILVVLILIASAFAIIETEQSLVSRLPRLFDVAEVIFAFVFTVEYAARLWTVPERRPNEPAWRERLLFLVSPAALGDLLVILASLTPLVGSSVVMLRWIRLIRIMRLAKLGRFTRAFQHLMDALRSRSDELALSLLMGGGLVVLSATALHLAEGAAQPDKFGSIPRALWWAVMTMTTIGYGDVFPITPLGKLFASATAILSIGLIAMPTGILAAAFSDAMAKERNSVEKPT